MYSIKMHNLALLQVRRFQCSRTIKQRQLKTLQTFIGRQVNNWQALLHAVNNGRELKAEKRVKNKD